MKQLGIPAHPQDVTTDWLTRALRTTGFLQQTESVEGFESVVLGDGKGFTGRVFRLTLDYGGAADGRPASVIAKFPPADDGMHAALHRYRIYEREQGFYASGVPTPGFRVPRCHYRDFDPESGASILLLEDFVDATPYDLIAGLSLRQVEPIAGRLAGFHAAWWESAQLDAMTWLLPFDVTFEGVQESYEHHHVPKFVDQTGDRVPAQLVGLAERMIDHRAWVREQLAKSPVTFIHGDFHPNNMLAAGIEADSPTLLIDWQVCHRAAGERDLMYFISSALSPDVRRSSRQSLIELYLHELQARGVADYSMEQCLDRYRLALLDLVPFLVTVVALLDFTVNEEAEAVLERILDRWGGAVLDEADIEDLLPK